MDPAQTIWDRAFQSTPSGGKATSPGRGIDVVAGFNPRLPGGRRPGAGGVLGEERGVSIHAFRGEGDSSHRVLARLVKVSIHAFRGEGDRLGHCVRRGRSRFNPRLPGGRRPATCDQPDAGSVFQSTPSGGKATIFRVSHATAPACFNPRLPGGRRHDPSRARHGTGVFQSTPSGGKATVNGWRRAIENMFQSTPSGGKATQGNIGHATVAACFNPRLPGGRAFQSSHLILPGERTPTRAARQSPVAHRECTDSPVDAGA